MVHGGHIEHAVLEVYVSGTESQCHGFVSIIGVSQAALSYATWEEGHPRGGAPGSTARSGGQVLEWLQVPA